MQIFDHHFLTNLTKVTLQSFRELSLLKYLSVHSSSSFWLLSTMHPSISLPSINPLYSLFLSNNCLVSISKTNPFQRYFAGNQASRIRDTHSQKNLAHPLAGKIQFLVHPLPSIDLLPPRRGPVPMRQCLIFSFTMLHIIQKYN